MEMMAATLINSSFAFVYAALLFNTVQTLKVLIACICVCICIWFKLNMLIHIPLPQPLVQGSL